MGSGIEHDDWLGSPDTHRSMEELRVVRELLSEARELGEPFTRAFSDALEVVSPDIRAILRATTATWRDAYNGAPVHPRAHAAAALAG